MEENKILGGDMVLVRYNKRCKWKEARVWEVDFSRTLPYGIEVLKKTKIFPNPEYIRYVRVFRVNDSNIKHLKHGRK